METIKYKSLSESIKDFDKKQGIVVIGINAFDVVDSDGDISLKGSFNRTVKNNFSRIKHFFNHDRSQIVGLPKEFAISNKDIAVHSLLNLKTSAGKDLFANYEFFAENNRTLEHSIGAIIKESKPNEHGGETVNEWKLLEYSTVAFGANENTPTYDIKSEMDVQKALQIVEKLAKLDYSDETKQQIEKFYYAVIQFKQNGSQVFGSQTAPEAKAPKFDEQKILSIIQKINI
jgi:HK97 family phage prohead protease